MFRYSKCAIVICFSFFILSPFAQAFTVEKNIEYDSVDGVKLLLDVYRSSTPTSEIKPALIYTHGGCYSMGSKDDIHDDVKKLADAGFVVFSVDYRLSGVAKYPAGLTDVQQAVRFVRKNAKLFQVDPKNIAAHGESAGGYLAAALGLRPALTRTGQEDDLSQRVQFVLDWYGRTDFTQTQTTGTDCAVSWLGVPRNTENMLRFQEASLLPYVSSQSASFLILHGTSDTQVLPMHSEALADQLKKSERSVELVWVKNAGHGFNRSETWKLSTEWLLKKVGISLSQKK